MKAYAAGVVLCLLPHPSVDTASIKYALCCLARRRLCPKAKQPPSSGGRLELAERMPAAKV